MIRSLPNASLSLRPSYKDRSVLPWSPDVRAFRFPDTRLRPAPAAQGLLAMSVNFLLVQVFGFSQEPVSLVAQLEGLGAEEGGSDQLLLVLRLGQGAGEQVALQETRAQGQDPD